MAAAHDTGETRPPFLRIDEAEIRHGPTVIADKVAGALRDADRFDLPHVKPPLSEALRKVTPAQDATDAADPGVPEQDALGCTSAVVDDDAGSSESLEPGGSAANR